MKRTQKRGALALFVAMALGGFTAAGAQEMPPRKPGLWKQTQYDGGKTQEAEVIYQCVDAASDKKLWDMAKGMGSCTGEPLKRKGKTMVGQNTCEVMGSKVTTDFVITGDMNSEYRIESQSKHEPPLFGQSHTKTLVVAEWQGPCKPGQKPGDMVVQGEEESTINIGDMGNLKDMASTLEQLQKMQSQAGGATVDMQELGKMMEQLQRLQKPQ